MFLAREQYGGSPAVRKAITDGMLQISQDLASDLRQMPRLKHLERMDLDILSDLIVKTVYSSLSDVLDPPQLAVRESLQPQFQLVQKLRFIMIGAKLWRGIGGRTSIPDPGQPVLAAARIPLGCRLTGSRASRSAGGFPSTLACRRRRPRAPLKATIVCISRDAVREPAGDLLYDPVSIVQRQIVPGPRMQRQRCMPVARQCQRTTMVDQPVGAAGQYQQWLGAVLPVR